MSKLLNLKQTLFKENRPWERQLFVWGALFVVGSVLVIVAAYYFDMATESKAFCGQLCHPNTPQLVAQSVAAHADVECGTCHVGPGLPPKVMAKINGTKELYYFLTNSFERPITHPVSQLRSADVICEQCHSPHMPYEDQLERISHFADDETNSETQTLLAMRIGDEGQETGAHWHIDNPVWYVSREVDSQNIPWVGTLDSDGSMVEYTAVDSELTAEELGNLDRQEVDCMTCHNRVGHQFHNPEERVDLALASGDMDRELPYIKREAMRLLSASYSSQEKAFEALGGLADFYRAEYPDVYAGKGQAVQQAIETLQAIYSYTTFPTMNLTWDVYPDNLGHQDFPGCFRCHDGKHVDEQGISIPANCTLCHSLPVTADQDGTPFSAASLVVTADQVPDSHKETNFMSEHRILADESCADCHGTIQFGTDNTSFCANGACHGQAVFKPELDVDFVHPVELTGQHATAACNDCHQGVREPSIQDCSTCHTPVPEPHFGSTCGDCHTTESWSGSAVSWIIEAPSNPHNEAISNCYLCHDSGGVKPVPDTHSAFVEETCLYCHETESFVAVPDIPHRVELADNCLTCHGEGVLKPASATHQGIPAESCLACHKSGTVEDATAIPHIVEDRDRCLTCHDQGRLVPTPPGHQGWKNESCLLCHETTAAE